MADSSFRAEPSLLSKKVLFSLPSCLNVCGGVDVGPLSHPQSSRSFLLIYTLMLRRGVGLLG